MLNSIKADYYRLVRSVGFWGIQAFCVLGILLAIFTSRLTTSSSGFFFAMDAVSYNIGLLFIACNVVTTLLLGVDLNNKLYHNNLTTGKTRGQYYLAKSLTIASLILLQFFLLYAAGYVIEFLRSGGQMGSLPADFWPKFLITFLIQCLCTYAWFCVTSFVLFLTRNYSMVFIVYFTVFIFLKIPGELIDPNNDWFKAIVMEFVYESTASFSMTSKTAIFALALSLIFTLAGIYTFKRRDL